MFLISIFRKKWWIVYARWLVLWCRYYHFRSWVRIYYKIRCSRYFRVGYIESDVLSPWDGIFGGVSRSWICGGNRILRILFLGFWIFDLCEIRAISELEFSKGAGRKKYDIVNLDNLVLRFELGTLLWGSCVVCFVVIYDKEVLVLYFSSYRAYRYSFGLFRKFAIVMVGTIYRGERVKKITEDGSWIYLYDLEDS